MQRVTKYAMATLISAPGVLFLRAYAAVVPPGTWIGGGAMTEARRGASAVLVPGGNVLITGGVGAEGVLAGAEVSSTAGAFTADASMRVARSGHTSSVLQDGRVLVAGGVSSGDAATDRAEIYDPATNRWSLVGSMQEACSGHTASLLSDGRVLITGSAAGDGASTTLEILDPETSAFTDASSARKNHAAAVLHDGRVLIVGSSDGPSSLPSLDIYDPATESVSSGPGVGKPQATLAGRCPCAFTRTSGAASIGSEPMRGNQRARPASVAGKITWSADKETERP